VSSIVLKIPIESQSFRAVLTDALLRHDHRWENLAEGLTGGRA